MATSIAHGHSHAIDNGSPSRIARERSASNDSTNAHDANPHVITNAHQYVNPPARVRTSTAIEWVAASRTSGGTSAAPDASATLSGTAVRTAWVTLPVTDIAVAAINHSQKNRVAPAFS
jgi:hypothetical protein